MTEDLDRNVRACDDFYRFANGSFLRNNPIPAAFSRWGRFEMLRQHNRDTLRTILEEAAASRTASTDPDVRRLGTFYASCMGEAAISRQGLTPIQPILARIDAIESAADVSRTIGWLHNQGILGTGIGFTAAADVHNPNVMLADVSQGGTGLPDRTYYFEQDAKSQSIRDAYVKHITAMLRLSGVDPARAARDAASAMKIETALAKGSLTRAERRDPAALDNPMTVAEMQRLTPNFDWSEYLRTVNAPAVPKVNVNEPKFLDAFNQALTSASPEEWKVYLRWRAISFLAAGLPADFVAENFQFYGKTLAGRQEQLPRWQQCIDAADTAVGDALGRLYVERAFPPSAKAHAQQMIDNLIAALRSNLGELAWMSPVTREQAAQKLARYSVEIGYPSKWRDYSALKMTEGAYVSNTIAANAFELHRRLNMIGNQRDRTEWELNPYEVNAYNEPTLNSITFLAGILQPPFFDPAGDDGYNYGGMGAVIGHEIIHGFDDEGRRFDSTGNLHDWWQADDSKQFDARASCVEQQFSSFVVGDVHVNGKLVLGESIADLGGLKIAYAAYQKSLEGKARTTVDGFTPEQRFFLGWARIWATSATPQAERLQTTSNEHPVSRFRVNGPLANMPEFAAAFHCGSGTSMVRADRCTVW